MGNIQISSQAPKEKKITMFYKREDGRKKEEDNKEIASHRIETSPAVMKERQATLPKHRAFIPLGRNFKHA